MYSFEENRVVRHTGTEFPIFQAPIGLISRADLVGAVSAAGGVGLMETASLHHAADAGGVRPDPRRAPTARLDCTS